MQSSRLLYSPQFFNFKTAMYLFFSILNSIKFDGKSSQRATAWFGPVPYTYGNIVHEAKSLDNEFLLSVLNTLNSFLSCSYNSVLVNYYRDGQDHVKWHSDNEKQIDLNTPIASLSLGTTRTFEICTKSGEDQQPFELRSGSLLVMDSAFQQEFLHRIPCDSSITSSRLNLTFRKMLV